MTDEDIKLGDTPSQFQIVLRQRDMREAWALYSHLRNVFHVAIDHKLNPQRPAEISHFHALNAAGSLRALFLDTKPLLKRFLDRHSLDAPTFCLESNLSLFFLSIIEREKAHVSDFFVQACLNPDGYVHGEDGPTFRDWKSFAFFSIANDEEGKSSYKQMFESVGDFAPFGSMSDGQTKSSYVAPTQIVDVNCKEVDLRDLPKQKMGEIGEIPIRRENIISHVANVLGGVHFDELRSSARENAGDYQAGLKLYDWNDQAIVNGALVAIGVISIEVASSPTTFGLFCELEKLLSERQKRLESGEGLPE